MFENLSERLLRTVKNLRGQGRLTEDNIKDALREVRMALLEADVALPVVREFIDRVRERAIGEEVLLSLTPGQVLIKIVHEELIRVMGEANAELNLRCKPPAVVLMAGLQGSGKTTSVAKLARWLKERQRKKVMVVSCDVYRPAAIEQLRKLAGEVGAEFFPSTSDQAPETIARQALDYARLHGVEVLIVDTAGRLHIDEEMMAEIQRVHTVLDPIETLFVVDSMTGQDAAVTAQAFDKLAADRCGTDQDRWRRPRRRGPVDPPDHRQADQVSRRRRENRALEPFYPDRVASRILGKGDVLSLVEEMEQKVDKEKALKLAQKVQKGKEVSIWRIFASRWNR
jgi:signal recognition particle subunit SRP54